MRLKTSGQLLFVEGTGSCGTSSALCFCVTPEHGGGELPEEQRSRHVFAPEALRLEVACMQTCSSDQQTLIHTIQAR